MDKGVIITAANSPVANCDDTVVARFAEPLVETGREAGVRTRLSAGGHHARYN